MAQRKKRAIDSCHIPVELSPAEQECIDRLVSEPVMDTREPLTDDEWYQWWLDDCEEGDVY